MTAFSPAAPHGFDDMASPMTGMMFCPSRAVSAGATQATRPSICRHERRRHDYQRWPQDIALLRGRRGADYFSISAYVLPAASPSGPDVTLLHITPSMLIYSRCARSITAASARVDEARAAAGRDGLTMAL